MGERSAGGILGGESSTEVRIHMHCAKLSIPYERQTERQTESPGKVKLPLLHSQSALQ